jgi:predicted nucleic acid-binding Zn ribbon protein
MDRKTKKLLKQLDSSDAKERYDAVLALGKTGDVELLDRLETVATLDENQKVRILAQKAVNTLGVLRQREQEAERQARIAKEIEEEGEDTGVDWKPLAVEKVLKEREVTDGQKYEEWSYVESKRKALERRKQLEAEAEARRIAEEKERIRRRRPYRLFMYLVFFLLAVFLMIALWYFVTVDVPPDSRAAALSDLEIYVDQQRQTLITYQAQLVLDPIDCKTITAIGLPETPRWVKLLNQAPSTNRFQKISDDLSSVGDSNIEGLDPILASVHQVDTNLLDLKTGINTACSGRDLLPLGEWFDYPVMIALIDDEQLGASVLNISAAAGIRAEVTRLPPETRVDALNRLKEWLVLQTESADYIDELLASDPLNCLALRNLSIPERPAWILNSDLTTGELAGLNDVVSALDDVEGNLEAMDRGIETGCIGRNSLPKAEYSAFPQIEGLSTKVRETINVAGVVIDAGLAAPPPA